MQGRRSPFFFLLSQGREPILEQVVVKVQKFLAKLCFGKKINSFTKTVMETIFFFFFHYLGTVLYSRSQTSTCRQDRVRSLRLHVFAAKESPTS